ncbi:glycosyl transferase family 1 [Candidatus Falkowbacteria bacterium CG10_big_fil_rev_8_21_14_0_10_43_11]|uniref:Glycosyl transferase family 1 n=1 Tax=Candidatus Falkowbacteria bacterium CG10_big_fil_rev_8_21_14_0_10_43_11 TaxID=1974568 RepID=A0A2M6WLD4_9BACT|nr:MAG: glycosyl transferase family 1 [Candidatus Falkowbacteria bacterium CG10_big_fil_rev_8_21_14_0_10_43_11]
MKVYYYVNARIPTEKAHGRQIMENCHALAKQGVDVTLILPRRHNRLKKDPFVFYGLKKNFKLNQIFCFDLLPLAKGKRIFFIIEAVSFALSALGHVLSARGRYDVLYTRDLIIAAVFSLLNKPLFHEVHNLPDKISWWHRLIWRRCRGIIVISAGLGNELIKNKIEADKILIARDGVNLEKFNLILSKQAAREKLKLNQEKKMVLYTGHLYSWKGADLLARAAAELPADAAVYLVGGTAEDINNFQKKYRAANLEVVGYRPAEEIPLWLKAADVLVLPNSAKEKISSFYTSPLKLFEYLSSGRPIVAADLPSIREVLNDDNSILVPPDDLAGLAMGIGKILNDPALAAKISTQSLRDAQQYSWDRRVEKIIAFIKNQKS